MKMLRHRTAYFSQQLNYSTVILFSTDDTGRFRSTDLPPIELRVVNESRSHRRVELDHYTDVSA